jgi:hypothetical protein
LHHWVIVDVLIGAGRWTVRSREEYARLMGNNRLARKRGLPQRLMARQGRSVGLSVDQWATGSRNNKGSIILQPADRGCLALQDLASPLDDMTQDLIQALVGIEDHQHFGQAVGDAATLFRLPTPLPFRASCRFRRVSGLQQSESCRSVRGDVPGVDGQTNNPAINDSPYRP